MGAAKPSPNDLKSGDPNDRNSLNRESATAISSSRVLLRQRTGGDRHTIAHACYVWVGLRIGLRLNMECESAAIGALDRCKHPQSKIAGSEQRCCGQKDCRKTFSQTLLASPLWNAKISLCASGALVHKTLGRPCGQPSAGAPPEADQVQFFWFALQNLKGRRTRWVPWPDGKDDKPAMLRTGRKTNKAR